jgi:hypothetical protein
VVCTKCGFDYRTGKKLEFLDRTKRIGDEVTYKQIFNTPFQRDISNQTTDLLQGLVAVGSGFSTLFLIRWIVFAFLWTQVDEDVAHLVRRISNIALGLVITFLQGAFWFRSMVKACSLTALGVSTEMGGFFLNGLYCYLIRFVALLPLGLVFLLGYRSHELDYEAWLHSGPLVVAAVLAFIWNTIYVPMAVAAFAVDASINPLVVAYWFGRSFLDLLLLIGYFLLFYLLLWAPVLGFFGYLLYEFGDGGLMSIIIIFIAWNVYQILWGFTSVATYATLGLVLKKNSEW